MREREIKRKEALKKVLASHHHRRRKFVFLLLMIFTPFPQISAFKATSPSIIHTKNTSGQQETPRKETAC